MFKKIWKAKKQDKDKAFELAKRLYILPLTASLLINRGIENEEEAKRFLFPQLSHLNDPFQLEGVERATARLKETIVKKEPIFLQGDYDVDGICATALLAKVLSSMGGKVFCYIPNRHKEGHGISEYAVNKALELGASVFLTVDCGSSSFAQVEKLNQRGVKVIITDHHETDEPPPAFSTINPKASRSYPFRELAGVGVAFKLAQALTIALGRDPRFLYDKLDLVALGTIADLASLLGENRVLVKYGLEKLGAQPSSGLDSLKRATGLNGYVDSHKVSFILAPRLNAPGRISSPSKALELLLATDEGKKEVICKELEEMNRERRVLEEKILQEMKWDLLKFKWEKDLVIVIKGENWNRGLLGLVASKLVDVYQRPAFVLSKYGDRIKGSGRSIPSFNIYQALQELSHLLLSFGGHNTAVGLEMHAGRFEEFKEGINEVARKYLTPEDLYHQQEAEHILSFQDITPRLAKEITLFSPFGIDNPRPLFISKDVEVKGISSFSNGKYTYLTLVQEGKELSCLSPTALLEGLPKKFSIIYALDIDRQFNEPLLILKGWAGDDTHIIAEERVPYLGQLMLWEELI